ncbi:M20/M25/M40 family metallo-hydrolase [candidate division KSB1 bacterium]|nr:M20/M25/M40 family metallo-hydrolase [candidate division KSB1 bacterium]
MESDRKRITDIFLDLVCIDGVSLHERKVADYVISFLHKLKIPCFEDAAAARISGNAGNIIASKKGVDNSNPLLLMAHLDTVSSTADLVPVVEDGVIRSSGNTILGADDRAGVAIILYVLERLSHHNDEHRDIEIVFSVAEELGMFGSIELDIGKLSSKEAIILDCSRPFGSFVQYTPTAIDFNIDVFGKKSHSAVSPENGVNAIMMAVNIIHNMLPLGRVDDDTVFNIGTIHGGTAVNVVPDAVSMTGEIRSFREETIQKLIASFKHNAAEISKQYGGNIEFNYKTGFHGFTLEDDLDIIRKVRNAFKNLNIELCPLKYYGGSDANIINRKGINAVNVGIGTMNPHSCDETMQISDLLLTANFVLSLLEVR